MNIASLYQLYLQHPAIQTDSRRLRKGDIFFALKGPNFNGNLFAQKALEGGAAYVVVDEAAFAIDDKCILVDDVLTALQELANYHRLQFRIPFIAITGSNGKTTTKELVSAVLSRKFSTYATEGNLNNHIGVPLTLLKIKQDAEMAVIEMGANHRKEIESYCKIAMPTHGIITNCGKAHIEGFGGIEGVKKGKGELYDFLRHEDGIVFRNADLDYLEDMAKGISKQVTYGNSLEAKYRGEAGSEGALLSVTFVNDGNKDIVHTQLVGDYNFPNLMAAVACGLHFGIHPAEIKAAIEAYSPDNSRSQLLHSLTNEIILDAYNANPSSMRAAINNFAKAQFSNKILWLGGMKEMGRDEAKEHEELVAFICGFKWQDVILVGKEFEDVKGSYKWFPDSLEAGEYVRKHIPANSAILIKGSRGSKMEQMLNALNA